MPIPFFNYFLGKEEPEFLNSVDPEKSAPPQISPETLKMLGLDETATPEQVQEEIKMRESLRCNLLILVSNQSNRQNLIHKKRLGVYLRRK